MQARMVVVWMAMAVVCFACDSGSDDAEGGDVTSLETEGASGFEGVDNGDGTITDQTTELMWEAGCSEWLDWESALSRCDELDLAGHDDWRLPTVDELRSLITDCPATAADGPCLVTATCADEAQCNNDACYLNDCQNNGGGGVSGCFMAPAFTATCDSADTGAGCESLWSETPTTAQDKVWRVDFESAKLAPVLADSAASTRCVRTP